MQDQLVHLPIGMIVRDRYIIKNLISAGSSGAVYLVEDQRVTRNRPKICALKEISGLNKQERYKLTFDSVSLRQLGHPVLPHIYHVFSDDKLDRVFMVMDYIEGPDLETLLRQQPGQRFNLSQVSTLMAPIADAIDYLHRQETLVVHGDIKPINIILVQSETQPILVDFGVARTHPHDVSGVSPLPGFKALEQYGMSVDERADVYGFAATCYALLTGVLPVNALYRASQLAQEQTDPLRPAHELEPAISLSISQALDRAMSQNPSDRFTSIEQFWLAFQSPPRLREATKTDNEDVAPPRIAGVGKARNISTPAAEIPVVSASREKSERRVRPERPGSISIPPAISVMKIALPVALVLLLVGAGLGFWLFWPGQHSKTATSTLTHTTATAAPARSTPVVSATAPVATPTSSSSSPGIYPSIVGTYTGTFADISSKESSALIFQSIHQVGAHFNGFLTIGSPLRLSGPFSGTIDLSKHFQFLVTDATGHPLLFVEGAIQTATSISGDFYSCVAVHTQSTQCIRAANGYGIWSALLPTSS